MSAPPRRWPGGAGALGHPFLRAYAGATLLSQVGVHADGLARAWIASGTSLLAVGVLGLASNGADIVCGLWLARRGRVRNLAATLLGVQAGFALLALALAALAAGGGLRVEHLVAASLLKGALNAPARAVGHALATRAVRRSQAPSVSALLSSLTGLARLVGPALGGVVLALGHPAYAFGFNALTFLPLIALLARRVRHRRALQVPRPEAAAARAPGMRLAMLAALTPGLFGIPYLVLLPGVARAFGGSEVLGALTGAVGLGALAGGLVALARRVRAAGSPGPGLAALGALQMALIGLLGTHGGLLPALLCPAVVALVAGLNTWYMARVGGFVGHLSAGADGARLFATYYTALLGAMALAEPLIGALGDAVGTPAALGVVAGAGLAWCAGLALLLARASASRG